MPSIYRVMPRFNVGLKESDFHEGKLALVKIGDNNLVLGMANGKIYAMDSVCSHEGGPLEEGTLKGYELTCPWHQGVFDIRNARASSQTNWVTDLKSYMVFVDVGGEILIDADINSANSQITKNETQDRAINARNLSLKPMILEIKLMKKISYEGTDIMSFQFSRGSDQNYLQYIAGQYVLRDLGTNEDPEGPDRSFTLASSPTEKDHILISTRIRQTPFKQKLRNLAVGSIVNITAPLGEFVLHEDISQPAVFLSGGIGVTPFRSMIKYATDMQSATKITMFDSNRNLQNILYKEEFDNWQMMNKNLKIVYTITPEEGLEIEGDWTGETGYINKDMISKYLDDNEIARSIFYLCGPPAMLNAMKSLLVKEMNLPQNQIKEEEFYGY